jgi:hypothetical protein
MLLFANVRATILSRKWQAPDTPVDVSEMPERSTSSFGDKLANVMPGKLWPRTRYVFFPLACILILISLLGMVGLPMMKNKQAAAERNRTVIQVSPPQ